MSKSLREELIARGVIVPQPASQQESSKFSKKSNIKQSEGKGFQGNIKDSKTQRGKRKYDRSLFFPVPDLHSSVTFKLYWLAESSKYLKQKSDPEIQKEWGRVAYSVYKFFNKKVNGTSEEYNNACDEICKIIVISTGYLIPDLEHILHRMIKVYKSETVKMSKANKSAQKHKKKKFEGGRYKPTSYTTPIIWIRGKTGFNRWGS